MDNPNSNPNPRLDSVAGHPSAPVSGPLGTTPISGPITGQPFYPQSVVPGQPLTGPPEKRGPFGLKLNLPIIALVLAVLGLTVPGLGFLVFIAIVAASLGGSDAARHKIDPATGRPQPLAFRIFKIVATIAIFSLAALGLFVLFVFYLFSSGQASS